MESNSTVVNSHVITCPSCGREHAVAVVWDDGDVDVMCAGCKHNERLTVEEDEEDED